jgi:hypothetical protein
VVWSRGFFRLWVILSLGWAVYIVGTTASGWKNNRDWLIVSEFCAALTTKGEETLLPYELDEIRETGRQVKYPHALRVAVPEVLACDRSNRLSANLRLLRRSALEIAITLLVPPLLLFGCGAVVGWIFSGFRASAKSSV